MATLYQGLLSFKNIYDSAVSSGSGRQITPISQDWQTVNSEMTCYYNAAATGDSTAAETHLNNIIAILNGYDLTIDLPVPLPISLSVNGAPSTILIPTDSDGTNPVYTNAFSAISILQGTSDETSNWTFAVTTETGVTAVIQNDNEVKIDAITGDAGSVVVTASRDSYSDLAILIPAQKQKRGLAGSVDNVDGETIVKNISGDIEANKVQVDDTRDLYAVNSSGDIGDIVGSTSSGNTYINASLRISGDTDSAYTNNIYILCDAYHGGSAFDLTVRDSIFCTNPSGGTVFAPASSDNIIDGSIVWTSKNSARAGQGIGKYCSALGASTSAHTTGTQAVGMYAYNFYFLNGLPFTNYAPRKIFATIETYTDGTAGPIPPVVFGNSEEFKVISYIESVLKTEYFEFRYDTGASNSQVGHIIAYITGRDMVTGDLLFREYTMQVAGVTLFNVAETVAKSITQGTLAGTTFAFPATVSTFNPTVTSGSTNGCHWSMMLDITVSPYR